MTELPAGGIVDQFDSATGVLKPGPEDYRVDEVVVYRPWPVSINELTPLGAVSNGRAHLLDELTMLVEWLWQACGDDTPRIWVRGPFGSTLWNVVEELDVVVIYDPGSLSDADRWVLRLFTASHVDLHPGRLTVTALRQDDEWVDKEARRSAVRVTDPQTGRPCTSGWIEITKEGGP